MPSSMGSITRHTFFGIVDVVDLHTLVKHTGAGHFAAVFADAVHIVAGVSPTQLSILDVQPLDTTRITPGGLATDGLASCADWLGAG